MKKYKEVSISLLLALLCIISAYGSVNLNKVYDIYFSIGFLLPCIVGCFCKGNYYILCSLASFASVFLIPDQHGFSNIVPAFAILFWNIGHVSLWKLEEKLSFSFIVSCLYELILWSAAILLGLPLCHHLAELNIYYPFGYAYSYLPYNILNARIVFLAEVLILAFLILDLLKTLPVIKQAMHRKIYRNEFNNNQFALIIFLMAVIVFVLSMPSEREGITYFTISINSYENSMGNLQLILFKEILVFLIGDFVIHFLEYCYYQEAEKLEVAEIQKAVFESSNDMIWSIDGKNNDIILANTLAKNFFCKKAGKKPDNFLDIFGKNEKDIWSEYIAEGLEHGKYITEYYDETMKKYYNLVVSKVSLDQKNYDMAFFAKDITEEVELNERIRNINGQLENKVQEKTKDLKQAYKELNEYTHQIAHEIKAPLRAIQLYNEIVKNSLVSCEDSETIKASEQINYYCRKSIAMLADILDYSKSRTQTLRYEEIDMYSLVNDIIIELCDIFKDQKISYQIGKLPKIKGDRNLLRSCLFNILSNSFKYSSKKEKTNINVSCRESDGKYIFSFKDNGAGFDMRYAEHLFEMFCRMHTDSEFEGTGIGLALAKSVVERHGGKIWAEAYPDKGCTIYFSIPVRSKDEEKFMFMRERPYEERIGS